MSTPLLALVLADIGDVIGSIVGIIFLIVWVIGQLSGAKKEAKPPAARQPPQPPRGQQAPMAQPQPAAAGGDPIRNQVEEFMRRVGQQQKAGAGKAAPAAGRPAGPPRDQIEILLEETPLERQRQPVRPADKPAMEPPRSSRAAAKQRPTPPRQGKRRRETMAEHSEQVDASSRALANRSAKLGQGLVEADQQFDKRLAARLDHKVGSLEERHAERMQQEQPETVAPTLAAQIAAMLTNPEGVRQAILLSEILRRPTDRWE
jgi:hypothetical protein